MELTKGWCLWEVRKDFLRDALKELTEYGAENILVTAVPEGKLTSFLIIYFNS